MCGKDQTVSAGVTGNLLVLYLMIKVPALRTARYSVSQCDIYDFNIMPADNRCVHNAGTGFHYMPFSVFPWRQCVYTHQAGRTPELQ